MPAVPAPAPPPRSHAHSKIAVTGKQHVNMYRKLLLRKRLLRHATEGACYVPFIGDGDIASALYSNRYILGADLDPARVETASSRLRGDIRVHDCDVWPFPGIKTPVSVADFDAYADPYTSFRAFWAGAEKADRLVIFFTDGLPQAILRRGILTKPSGEREEGIPGLPDRRRTVLYNAYLKDVLPWFREYIEPYRVLDWMRYRRHHVMYWGMAIEKTDV